MTNKLDQNNQELGEPEVLQDELTTLKGRADKLGIKYHPAIGVEKLRDKIDRVMNPENYADAPVAKQGTVLRTTQPTPIKAPVETKQQRNARLYRESSRLIRVNITCMNPNKKEATGEIVCVGNSAVGTFKKFVQFDTDEGFHIPIIIYNHLKERKCQVFINKRMTNGVMVKVGKEIKEFAIAVLDPLTQQEIKELATRQAMANGTA